MSVAPPRSTPSPNVKDHKLERLAECSARPVRVLHRGLEMSDDQIASPWLAYGADQWITAPARLVMAPVMCAKRAARARRASGPVAQMAAGTLGATWGLGKGFIGCGVAASAGTICLVEGIILGLIFSLPMKLGQTAVDAGRRADKFIEGGD